jgi:hypothetical protein
MTGSIVRQISSSLGVQSSRTSSTFLGEMIVREWEENDDEKSGLLTSEDFPPRNTDSSSISMKKDEEKESVNKNSSKDVILWNLCIRWFFIQALPIFALYLTHLPIFFFWQQNLTKISLNIGGRKSCQRLNQQIFSTNRMSFYHLLI